VNSSGAIGSKVGMVVTPIYGQAKVMDGRETSPSQERNADWDGVLATVIEWRSASG